MAVFQGARLREGAIPAREPAVRVRPVPAAERATRGSRPIGLTIAAILVATMLGLVYLTQTLGSNATSSQISTMADKSQGLRDTLNNQAVQVEYALEADRIAKQAKKLGLTPLGKTLVLRAP